MVFVYLKNATKAFSFGEWSPNCNFQGYNARKKYLMKATKYKHKELNRHRYLNKMQYRNIMRSYGMVEDIV